MKQSSKSRMWLFLLPLLLLLVAGATVSAQEGSEVGEEIVLRQVEGPDGVNTVLEIPVAQDTFISSSNPATNYGSSTSIRFGHNAGGAGALRPLVQFSLNSIPSNAVINRATLRLFLFATTAGDPPLPFEARHLNSGWNENVVTWAAHQPEWGSVFATGSARSTPLGWTETDVTTLVRDWHAGTFPNNGVTVIGDERPEVERQRWYHSKEAGNGLFPRLVVDFTIPPADTIPPTASVQPLPPWSPSTWTVNWSGSDNPGGSGIAFYDVQYRVNSTVWTDWRMRTTSTWAIWEGGTHNNFYEFRVRAVDNAGNVQAWTGAQAGTRVDSVPPTTSMTPLPQFTTSSSFTVSWQGADSNSGVDHYDLEGRLDFGGWQMILENTTQTSYRVSGLETGEVVEFRVRATDVAGNVQPFPEEAQASTLVVLEPISVVLPFDPLFMRPTDAITDTFTVQWIGFTAPGTNITKYELRYRFRPQQSTTFTPWSNVTLPSPTAQSVAIDGPFAEDGVYEFEVRAINSIGQAEAFTGQAEARKYIDLREPFIEQRALLPLTFSSGSR